MSIIPNICSAISSVTLTRTRFNKAINQKLTRGGVGGAAFRSWIWLAREGTRCSTWGTLKTTPLPVVTRGQVPIASSPRGLTPIPRKARSWKLACLVAAARGQRQNLLPTGCPVCALAAVNAPRVPGANAPRGAADTAPAAKALTASAPRSKWKISLWSNE